MYSYAPRKPLVAIFPMIAHSLREAVMEVSVAGGLEKAKVDLARLAHEISRADATLRALQNRAEKVRVYIEMAQIYEAEDGQGDVPKIRGGVSGAAVRAAVDAIRERKSAIHTRELLEILERQGIQIGGGNPVANLSGFLSRSEELRSSRSLGWGLAEWGTPTDEGAAADATLDGDVDSVKRAAMQAAIQQVVTERLYGDSPAAKPETKILTHVSSSDPDDEIPF